MRRIHTSLTLALLLLLTLHPAFAEQAKREAGPISDEVREQYALDAFYTKLLNADGLLFLGSDKVPDEAFEEAAYLIDQVLAGRDDLRKAIAKLEIRLVIMNEGEFTTDVPEHAGLKDHKMGKDWWDRRARGLGARGYRSAMSCGVENLLQYKGDPYSDENILIHEFAHVIDDVGLAEIDKGFEDKLAENYKLAMEEGLWEGGYGQTNRSEYWAECVQVWFFCNPPKARHDHTDVNTRAELKEHDPRMYKLLEEVFGNNDYEYTFPKDRKGKAHLSEWDFDKAPSFEWPERLKNINTRPKPKKNDVTQSGPSCPSCMSKEKSAQ
ncbi:MAG: hypothetical protein KTR15_05140 [Phycisphaeraceae bacterium]|nr:hypothetical protein [Phycisphaeraceae bacterium]